MDEGEGRRDVRDKVTSMRPPQKFVRCLLRRTEIWSCYVTSEVDWRPEVDCWPEGRLVEVMPHGRAQPICSRASVRSMAPPLLTACRLPSYRKQANAHHHSVAQHTPCPSSALS